MKYGSICSGIEAASVAWEPLGMRAAWLAEIEPFPSAVLAHHWPHVENHGDMCLLPAMIRAGKIEAPDVLVGGTPCQAYSVAGKRESLDDARGQLTLTYVEIANAIDEQREDGDECATVWENVPGVLSTHDNAFGCFLGDLAGSGATLQPGEPPEVGRSNTFWRWDKESEVHVAKWPNSGRVSGPRRSIAWRVIDAQYFGVAQRRRRVFVVASARDGFDPGQVLFESEGLRRDTPPSREAGQNVASDARASFTPSGFAQYREGVGTLKASGGDLGGGSESLVVHGTQDPCVGKDLAFTAGTNGGRENTVVAIQNATRGASQNGLGIAVDKAMYTLDTASQHGVFTAPPGPRRLTPNECARLQGFPDNHTDVPYKGKPAADGPQYKAYGNSKAVPCVNFVGRRLLRELAPKQLISFL